MCPVSLASPSLHYIYIGWNPFCTVVIDNDAIPSGILTGSGIIEKKIPLVEVHNRPVDQRMGVRLFQMQRKYYGRLKDRFEVCFQKVFVG